MTPEEKDLLLRDLCGRLPYGVKIHRVLYGAITLNERIIESFRKGLDDVLIPYLRPLSSMTEEETVEYCDLQDKFIRSSQYPVTDGHALFDWLNAHHFDYRGLIEKGLAIAVAEDNNLYNNIKDCDYEKEKSE